MLRRIPAQVSRPALAIFVLALMLPTAGEANPPAATANPAPAYQEQGTAASPEAQILREVLQTGVAREDFPRKARIDFFPAPDGNTFTLLVFEVGKETLTFAEAPQAPAPSGIQPEGAAPAAPQPTGPVADLEAYGAVTTQSPEGELQVIHQFLSPFQLPVDSGDEEFSGTHSVGMTIAAGSYSLTWGVYDKGSGQAHVTTEIVEIPDFRSGELVMTSVFVSTASQPQSEPYEPGRVYPGVRMGNIVFMDDIDRTVARDAMMEVIYVVMGTQQDPTTLKPSLEVTYRILDAESDESVARFPPQTMDTFSVGQPLPLAQIQSLEAGKSYELEIQVKDNLSGQQLMQRIPFSLPPEEGG